MYPSFPGLECDLAPIPGLGLAARTGEPQRTSDPTRAIFSEECHELPVVAGGILQALCDAQESRDPKSFS